MRLQKRLEFQETSEARDFVVAALKAGIIRIAWDATKVRIVIEDEAKKAVVDGLVAEHKAKVTSDWGDNVS